MIGRYMIYAPVVSTRDERRFDCGMGEIRGGLPFAPSGRTRLQRAIQPNPPSPACSDYR